MTYDTGEAKYLLGVAGGRVEPQDSAAIESAVRELREALLSLGGLGGGAEVVVDPDGRLEIRVQERGCVAVSFSVQGCLVLAELERVDNDRQDPVSIDLHYNSVTKLLDVDELGPYGPTGFGPSRRSPVGAIIEKALVICGALDERRVDVIKKNGLKSLHET